MNIQIQSLALVVFCCIHLYSHINSSSCADTAVMHDIVS